MTKCPYVPPHPWNLDFPHLMLRAKAVHFRNHGAKATDKFLTSTDKVGMFAGIPIVTATINAVNRTRPARAAMENVFGIDRNAWMPPIAPRKVPLRRGLEHGAGGASTAQRRRARWRSTRPATSTTTSRASATISSSVLEHNEIPYVLLEKEACCGMPKLEIGDLDSVAQLKDINIPQLAKAARRRATRS